jgi:hypothetical protein
MVVYIPLRVEPEWAGTVRHCVLERNEFERKFEHLGEGLPNELDDEKDKERQRRFLKEFF